MHAFRHGFSYLPIPIAVSLALQAATPTAVYAETNGGTDATARHVSEDGWGGTTYTTVSVDGIDVFYRAAGPADAPVILLLHGYPSSSHMFRDLIPLLAQDYRVIAPDMVGFGASEAPSRAQFDYSFDALAQTTDAFTEVLGLDEFAMYVFDYGAPIGFRLATEHPERITSIITQNGNAYAKGPTEGWGPIQAYWAQPTQENREALRRFQTLATTTWQYTHGTPKDRLTRIGPDGPAHDIGNFTRPEGSEIQLDLFLDYQTNVALYPAWQDYLRTHQPPVLVVWGENDPFFGPEGAHAFTRDVPDAELHLLDAGHFALETHAPEIAALMRDFLRRHLTD